MNKSAKVVLNRWITRPCEGPFDSGGVSDSRDVAAKMSFERREGVRLKVIETGRVGRLCTKQRAGVKALNFLRI